MQNSPYGKHCLGLFLLYLKVEYVNHRIHIWDQIFCSKSGLKIYKCEYIFPSLFIILPEEIFFTKHFAVSDKTFVFEGFVAMGTFQTFGMPIIV